MFDEAFSVIKSLSADNAMKKPKTVKSQAKDWRSILIFSQNLTA